MSNNNNNTAGKRPDAMNLTPWKTCKPILWDVTVTCITAASYIDSSTRKAGAEAEITTMQKMAKYSNLSPQQTFYPASVETQGHS